MMGSASNIAGTRQLQPCVLSLVLHQDVVVVVAAICSLLLPTWRQCCVNPTPVLELWMNGRSYPQDSLCALLRHGMTYDGACMMHWFLLLGIAWGERGSTCLLYTLPLLVSLGDAVW